MRETAIFFLYLFGCLLLGALLTYPLLHTGWIEYDPHRVMGRLTQVFVLLGLRPFLRAMDLSNRQALGYGVCRVHFLQALLRGWLLGIAILLVLVSSLLLLAIRVPDVTPNDWLPLLLQKSIQVLVGGLLTSLLEETFFRGALYSSIRRNSGAASAILWSSFLFALLHFMNPHELPEASSVFDWGDAWRMFLHVFIGVFQWKHLDSMIALFLVGVFLALVRERSGHIGWGLGLHAGWIFMIQLTRYLTEDNPASPHAWLAGSYDGVIGWLAAVWIGMLALALWVFAWTKESKPAQG